MNPPFGGENITIPVATPNIADPTPGTVEHAHAWARDASTHTLSAMPWLPQMPDAWATELYERITDAERRYVAPHLHSDEYITGTVTKPDQVETVRGAATGRPYLFTAEHATAPGMRKDGGPTYADKGTGGLAAVLAEDYGTALIMRGRQTSNAPMDPEHPIKAAIRTELAVSAGFLAVHGKNAGMFVHPSDKSEIHACLGLGANPPEALVEFAHMVMRVAREDLGLYVVTSNEQPAYIQKMNSTEIKRLEDGSPKLSKLAALNPLSTTNFSRDTLRAMGHNVPAMQMELTSFLRAISVDMDKRDKKSRIIGVAMGYKLLEKVVELTRKETDSGQLLGMLT